MNPALAYEMLEVLEALEIDDRAEVLVLTGTGEAFSAGMDLKEYFRATDGLPTLERLRIYRVNALWQWRLLARIRSRRSRWSTAGASAARSRR